MHSQEEERNTSHPKTPLIAAQHALTEWLAHTLVVAGLLIGFWLIEQLVHLLWGENDRMLFDILPLHWVFDVADFAVLATFLTYGVISVLKAYKGISVR